MSIIYEVNVFVQPRIEVEYRVWLAKHIAQILEIPGFLDATSFDVQQDVSSEEVAICVQYRLASQTALDNYLQLHAPRLRTDGIAKFGDSFRASRRVLVNPLEFSSSN